MTETIKYNINTTVKIDENEISKFIFFVDRFLYYSEKKNITSLILEKILVLFQKYGIKRDLFITNPAFEKKDNIVRIRYYLFGPILSIENNTFQDDQYFFNDSSSSFTNYLINSNYLKKERSANGQRFTINPKYTLKDRKSVV